MEKQPDLVLRCKDCNQDWVLTAGEQYFYHDRGLENPKRCPLCRAKRKQEKRDRLVNYGI
jgi:rubrerythrin